MPPVQQQTTPQQTQQEAPQQTTKALPNTPVPQAYLLYQQAYSNSESNASYHALFTSRNLPEGINYRGQARIGIVEISSGLSQVDPNQGPSLMGTNAILASTLRGYCETIPGADKQITMIAPSCTWDPKIKANAEALAAENLIKVMKEAYGDLLDPNYTQDKNTITFSLKGGSGKVTITTLEIDGKKPQQLVTAVNASNSDAVIVLGTFSGRMHSLQIAAEHPSTAAYHRNPVENTSIRTAIENGVTRQLEGQIPVLGGQKISFKDIGDVEKFTTLQNAFKSGFRFVAEEHDGKQTIKIFKVNSLGVGQDTGLSVELPSPTISTYKTFAKTRAEQLYETVSKLLKTEAALVSPPPTVTPPKPEVAPTPTTNPPATNPSPSTEQKFEIKHQDKIVATVDKATHPELHRLLTSGELKFEDLKQTTRTNVSSSFPIHTYSLTYKDAAGQSITLPLSIKADGTSADSLTAIVSDLKAGKSVGLVGTFGSETYMISSSLRPKDCAQLEQARSLGYEILDIGNSVNGSHIYSLKNMTTYLMQATGKYPNLSYTRASGVIDLTFSVADASDGSLTQALETALASDKSSAKDAGSRQTEYLTRRNANNLIASVVEKGDIASLTKYFVSITEHTNEEAARLRNTGMAYRYSDAIGEVLSSAALRRGMSQEFADKIKLADLAIADTLAVVYSKSQPVIDAMTNVPEGTENAAQIRQERWERFALGLAKLVIEHRDKHSEGAIVEPTGRVIGILGRPSDFPAKSLQETFSKMGISDVRSITSEQEITPRLTNELRSLFSETTGQSLVYLWGHANQTGMSDYNTSQLAHVVMSVAPRSVDSNGQPVVDLSRLGFVFDGCYLGSIGGVFYNALNAEAKRSGVTISAYPDTYSSVQRLQLARYQGGGVAELNGEPIVGTPFSLLQEAIVNTTAEGQQGLSRTKMFEAAEYLNQYSLNRARSFEFARMTREPSHMKLNFAGQSPVIFDERPISIENLLEQVQNNMNSPEIKAPAEQNIRLGRPTKAGEGIMLHLSSLISTSDALPS